MPACNRCLPALTPLTAGLSAKRARQEKKNTHPRADKTEERKLSDKCSHLKTTSPAISSFFAALFFLASAGCELFSTSSVFIGIYVIVCFVVQSECKHQFQIDALKTVNLVFMIAAGNLINYTMAKQSEKVIKNQIVCENFTLNAKKITS